MVSSPLLTRRLDGDDTLVYVAHQFSALVVWAALP